MKSYIPSPGDLVWLEFNPQTGHEQAGHRPAMVVSQQAYNAKTGLALFCPISSKIKGYPFEVVISGKKICGAVLADQVKSLDWQARKAQFIDCASPADLEAVTDKISLIIGV